MKTIAFGEILWDIIDGTPHIGGAPYNVSCHLSKLGAEAAIISTLGNDSLGDQALEKVTAHQLDTTYLSRHATLPTGTVDVLLSNSGEPAYTINENAAWDNIIMSHAQLDQLTAARWDIFIFGTLAQRTVANRELLYQILDKLSAADVFFDVNLRQHYYQKEWIEQSLKYATILKLNADEVTTLSDLLFQKSLSLSAFAEQMAAAYALRNVLITLGGDGAAVWENGSFQHVPGQTVKVQDTVGAGDSFSAGFVFHNHIRKNCAEAARFGCQIGAYVASKAGALPDYDAALKSTLHALITSA